MRNLLNFIVKNIHWLFFLVLIIVSAFLIVKNNDYQRSKYLSVENEIVGKVYTVSSDVSSYMGLKTINQDLMTYIANRESRIQYLEDQLKDSFQNSENPAFLMDTVGRLIYEFTPARIVKNNISGTNNLMTLNKGSNDGIKIDMGVVSTKGIVGVVLNVTPHFSKVIPVLNPKFRPSCKVLGNSYFGPLVWSERDIRYAYLEELPRHVEFQIGDTVVTSGYSGIFPEGIPVGIIEEAKKQKNDNFNSLKVRLFTDFGNLNHVLVIKNNYKEEQLQLEKESENNVK